MRTDLLKPQRTQKWDGIGFTPSYITSLTLIGPLWDLIKKSMASLMAAALAVFFLKCWFPNEQRQPHLGDRGQKNVLTCSMRSLCPSCVRKTNRPVLCDSSVLWLLVSERIILSNRRSPLQTHQRDGDEVVERKDRELLGLFFVLWLFFFFLVCRFVFMSLFIFWIRVIVQHVWDGAKRVRALKSSQCPSCLRKYFSRS